MWMKNILLAILGLSAGITAAGGLFSFIIGLGVVSDFADRTHTGEHVMLYEDAIAVGGSIGAIISVYHPRYHTEAGWFRWRDFSVESL